MPITDYKVTDIERDAVKMEGKADPLMGTLAQNQAEFDEYPELVRDNLDGLCDYIATMPISYASSAAAATANKGSISGFVPLGAIIEISMINGNTAVSPTVSIDGVSHSITGMPVTAQIQANSTQTYRLVKTGATALTFTKNPDYVCEYGTNANGYPYRTWASGQTDSGDIYVPTVTSSVGAITSYSVTSGYYLKIGRKVMFSFDVSVTNQGTGSGSLTLTLPLISRGYHIGTSTEVSGTGSIYSIQTVTNASSCVMFKYDSSTPVLTGRRYVGTVSYITD